MTSLKKQCLLLVLNVNVMTSVIASEKVTIKPNIPKYDAMKSLRAYLDNLEKERLQKQYTVGSDLQHGGNYAGVNQNGELLINHNQAQKNFQPFGRGSSGEKAKL